MSKRNTEAAIPHETVMNKIFIIRGKKAMLDKDLAELYDVETKALNQAVEEKLVTVPGRFYVPVVGTGV